SAGHRAANRRRVERLSRPAASVFAVLRRTAPYGHGSGSASVPYRAATTGSGQLREKRTDRSVPARKRFQTTRRGGRGQRWSVQWSVPFFSTLLNDIHPLRHPSENL